MTNLIDEVVVLKSAFNKTPGMTYKIEPCKDPRTKRYPDCVRRVNANGDLVLSEQDIKDQSKGRVFIGENEAIPVTHGTTFHLNDPVEAAQWEAIRFSPIIARERNELDNKGNFVIDGAASTVDRYGNASGTYGLAELYVERPGNIAKYKNDKRKTILQAMNLVANDSLDHMVLICKLFEKDMSNVNSNDIMDYLMTKAEKEPETIIKYYQAEESKVRLLLIVSQEKKVVERRDDGLYYGDIKLGTSLDYVSDMLKNNKELYESIKKETFPDLTKVKK